MPASRSATFLLVFLGVSLGPYPLLAQAPRSHSYARNRGTDVATHKFHPVVSPDLISLDTSGAPIQSQAAIGSSAAQQINALLRDKQSRTAAQQKISSKLIYTARMLQGLPAAEDVASLETGVEVDDDGRVLVDLTAEVTATLIAQLKEQGASVYGSYPLMHSIRALLPASRLEAIASWPEVAFIHPKQEAMTARHEPRTLRKATLTGQGSKTSEGDLTHRAFDARMAFGVNGAGIKIGVLSDGASSLAASQALGDLPNDVIILPGQVGGGDEGTAMMEIVHDLAPAAKLYFATAFDGVASFAQNIRDLRAAGCDILIDDVFYFDENPFVDGQTDPVTSSSNGGLILQAVNDVTAAGAFYFSSAGNEGNLDAATAGAYEGDFVDAGALGLLAGGTVHRFATTPYNTISANGGNYVMLFWSDPLGASTNDYDLFVLNSTGTAVLEASTDVQNGTQDPIESLSPTYNVAGNRLIVFKHTSAQSRYFHLNTFRGQLAVATAGETHGHSQAAQAYSVAATPALAPWSPATSTGPYPNPFTNANQTEAFSSDGPRRIFYSADGTPITPGDLSSTGGLVRPKPDLTAADGVSISGVGGFGSPFYGTSAAAPHAGAIAALLESARPTITNEEMRTLLADSAVDILAPGADRNSGAGIVMAFEALLASGAAGSANPELGTIVAIDYPGNGNGFLEAGEAGMVTIELKNTGGVLDATAITATLSASTTGVIMTQPSVSAYPNLPRLTGTGNNLSAFTFTLASDYPCGQTIDFTLTVSYSGGPSPRVFRFSIPTGLMFNLDTSLSTVAPISPLAGVLAATGTQTGRPSRNGIPTTCATAPKIWPGTFDNNFRQYDSYTFTATQSVCTTFSLNAANGSNLFLDAYTPAFDPADIATSYYADSGTSSSTQSFSMALAAGATYVLNVLDVNAGRASGSAYNLQFSACALVSAGTNHAPIALARDVSAVADSTHTASASIDNGSYDPDPGDTITLTQTPASPYPVGINSVVLTATDNHGATAQASATVTVVDPNFDLGGQTLPSKTVTAGGSVTQTITVRPNPAPWNLTVTFACPGLPALATCAFNPATVVPGNNSATTTLTVTTTGPSAAAPRQARPLTRMAFLALLAMGAVGKRRRWRRFLLTFGIVSVLVNCGGSAAPRHTLGGSYTIVVSATSANVVRSTSFQLIVN